MYPIYLDYAATSPVDERVMELMLPYFTKHFGNSSSRFHPFGWEAEEAIEVSQKKIAKGLNCTTKEIVFTSGATESINLALKGVFEYEKGHLISVETEHKATLDTLDYLRKKGVFVSLLRVNSEGEIDLNELEKSIRPETKLISIMQVNNETGLIHPIDKISEIAKRNGLLLHVDATQAIGKISQNESIDLLSFSSHKIYGPKGIGLLKVKNEKILIPQIHGGKQQRGRRAGTLNIPGIVGIGKAFELAMGELKYEHERLAGLKKDLELGLLSALPNAILNSGNADRVPHISNICFKGLDGEELLLRLNKIAISNGSACNSASTEASYVLKAMGLSEQDAYSSLRFSLGRMTSKEEIDNCIDHVVEIGKELC